METKRYLEAMEEIMKKYYPECRYSFTGYQEESICMQSVQTGWIVYNAERGNHYDEISCDTVLMACLAFFRRGLGRLFPSMVLYYDKNMNK